MSEPGPPIKGAEVLDFGGKAITRIPKYDKPSGRVNVVVTNCERLTSLEGLPESVVSVRARNCEALKTWKGGPHTVDGNVFLQGSGIESLEGLMTVGGGLNLSGCKQLKNLHGIGMTYLKQCSMLYLPPSITSHVLGLMLIESLDSVQVLPEGQNKDLEHAIEIITKHYNGFARTEERQDDLIDLQHELIEAGLEDYAEL